MPTYQITPSITNSFNFKKKYLDNDFLSPNLNEIKLCDELIVTQNLTESFISLKNEDDSNNMFIVDENPCWNPVLYQRNIKQIFDTNQTFQKSFLLNSKKLYKLDVYLNDYSSLLLFNVKMNFDNLNYTTDDFYLKADNSNLRSILISNCNSIDLKIFNNISVSDEANVSIILTEIFPTENNL